MTKNKVFIVLLMFFTICPLVVYPAEYQDVVNKGVILLEQGIVEEAIKTFKNAENMQPNSAEVYYYLGEAYYLAGDRTEALENYKKAVELQDLNPDYHYAIALLYLSEGKKDEAIKKLDRVVEIAPVSITGRYAARLRREIKNAIVNEEMINKWQKIEEERRKPKEEEAKGNVKDETMLKAGLPEETAVKMLPVEQVVKRIRFGTETVRKYSSQQLIKYAQPELVKVSAEIISLFSRSKDVEIKRNLIITLGKVGTPESGDILLKTVQNKEELFDIRIVALENIVNIRTPEIIQALRNTLKGLVEARESERAEARKNIQDITRKTDEMQAKKIALNLEIQQNNTKMQEIQNKIGVGGYMPSPDFNMPQPEEKGIAKPLTAEEILKLQTEERKLREDITKKNEEIAKIDSELAELQVKKRRYETLLVRKGGAEGISMQSRTVMPGMSPEPYGEPGMSPEPYGEYVAIQETDEEKNETVFALSLINALGEMRDKESLPTIRKAWNEYEVETQKISYFLALARLGDYNNIGALIARLKQDYPQTDAGQEIKLRTGIIEVIGEYFAQSPDEELLGMIKYLSEEGEYPEIREAASKAISAVVKPPAK